MNRVWLLLVTVILVPQISRSSEDIRLPFSAVWSAVRASSPSEQAAADGRQASEIARDRSGRHWFPRAFLSARTYSTNDPAQTFFALLGERKASSADFVPSTLNTPGSNFFTQGSVGLDFPVFEGGAKVARHRAMESAARAKAFSAKAVSSEDYVNTARLYGALLALQEQGDQLQTLEQSVETILQQYRLGARGNPVGYSGLLGLKGLRNRLKAAIIQNGERKIASMESLSEMAQGLPAGWIPMRQEFLVFVNQTFPEVKPSEEATSFAVRSAQSMAQSLEKSAEGEKAKFLPKVGLFAEEDMVTGSRGPGASYTAGAYLQWSLFSATDYGAIHEAKLRAAEARNGAEARSLGERIERVQALHADIASEETIRLLAQDVQLLSEQTSSSSKLYRSGAINALQFIEVLSRRADVLSSLTDAELGLLTARATEFTTSGFEVPGE